jgi:phage anti-repressor protein
MLKINLLNGKGSKDPIKPNLAAQEDQEMGATDTIGGVEGMEELKLIESSIVPVYSDREERILINARDLHKFLGSGRQFANWIRDRIERYNFSEGEDYISFNEIIKRESGGGTTRIEYLLCSEMAKEIAILENNEKGRMVRKYFIECEKRLRRTGGVINAESAEKLRQRAKRLDIMDRNSRSRQAQILKSAANFFMAVLSDVNMQVIVSEITALIAGKRLVDLPEAERFYSAAEIGKMCGVSAGLVEQVVNELGLKTDKYGTFILSEGPNSKPTFQYRLKAVGKIREFLDGMESMSDDLPLEEDFGFSGFFL